MWDAVVVQDHSVLPTIKYARERMTIPAVAQYADALRNGGSGSSKHCARLLAYMTWPGLYGNSTARPWSLHGHCPSDTITKEAHVGAARGCAFPSEASFHSLKRMAAPATLAGLEARYEARYE
jgi:hypothetical protein